MTTWPKHFICAIALLCGVCALVGHPAFAADTVPASAADAAAKDTTPPLPAYFSGANADKD